MLGKLARTPKGWDLMIQLAELLQAPVFVGTYGSWQDFPNRHPLNGRGGPGYRPDVTLGLELNDLAATARTARANGGKTISICSEYLSQGRNIHDYGPYSEVDVAIAADGEATLPSLIEEINAFIKAKEAPLAVEEVGLQEIIQTMREEFAAQLEGRSIGCFGPEADAKIRADRLSILRVLRNLVENALKYGGRALSEIRIGHEETGESRRKAIQDAATLLLPLELGPLFGGAQVEKVGMPPPLSSALMKGLGRAIR